MGGEQGETAEALAHAQTFLDLCECFPKLRVFYSDPDRAEDREAALQLWLDSDRDALEVREAVVDGWKRKGLLSDVDGTALQRFINPVTAANTNMAEVRPDEPLAEHLQKNFIAHRRHAILEHRRKLEEERKRQEEAEKALVNERRRMGLFRNFQTSEEMDGEVVLLDFDRGIGEVRVPERHCNSTFFIDWVDYGLKELRMHDPVLVKIEHRQNQGGRGRFSREKAASVRPHPKRRLTDLDIVTFCRLCRDIHTPEKVVHRILISLEDWNTLLTELGKEPPLLGGTGGLSWLDCVMCIIELCTYPSLQETRFRPILAKLYKSMIGTPLVPKLTIKVAKVVSDNASLNQGLDVALFTENLRYFCFGENVRLDFYEEVCTLLTRLGTAFEGKGRTKKLDELNRRIQRIKQAVLDGRLFPTPACFAYPVYHRRNPMCHKAWPKTTMLPWASVNMYIGTHFALLKGDCFASTMSSIHYWARKANTPDGEAVTDSEGREYNDRDKEDLEYSTKLYTGVRYVGKSVGERGLWIVVRFNRPTWPMRFERESVVCLTVNSKFLEMGTKLEVWWATIPFVDQQLLDSGVMVLNIVDGNIGDLISKLQRNEENGVADQESWMFGTNIFLAGYVPVLEALSHLRKQPALPFNDLLLKGVPKGKVLPRQLPGYVSPCYQDAFERIIKRMLGNYVFEPGQAKALRWLASRPVLLIQGPPGTGKSFIGCRIVEVISEYRLKMKNGELRNEYQSTENEGQFTNSAPGPIIVLTYKNHALDEFLLDCLDSSIWCGGMRDPNQCLCRNPHGGTKYCCKECCDRQGHVKRLVRVGMRSKAARLLKYNLMRNVKPKKGLIFKQKIAAWRKKMEEYVEYIAELDAGVLSETTLQQCMTQLQQQSFCPPTDELTKRLDRWLGPDTRLVIPPEETAVLAPLKEHALSIGIDPDDIDNEVNKEIAERIKAAEAAAAAKRKQQKKRRREEQGGEAADDDDEEENDEEGAAKSNFGTIKKEAVHIDDDIHGILQLLRARRTFHSTFISRLPKYCVDLQRETYGTGDADDMDVDGEEGEKKPPPPDEAKPKHIPPEEIPGDIVMPKCAKVDNLWDLGMDDRKRVAVYWLAKTREKVLRTFERDLREFEALLLLDQQNFEEGKLEALQKADIIGLTTTGAAMHQAILRAVRPSVLMVEEAAEILEAQTLSCLVDSVQQVILIGDHKQLRPSVDNMDYAKYNLLCRSLFERLADTCNVPCVRLTEQRRMRPAIADLVRPIYLDPPLTDHISVSQRKMRWGSGWVERIPHIPAEAIFWEHSAEEMKSSEGMSVMNPREAEMAVFLAKWLVCKDGLLPEQLTVLTPYIGQTRILKKALQDANLKGVKAITVDRFQGDENDVIIVSLVRTSKLTTFMRLENRMCVALSRARFNFFLIGSPKLLQEAEHWKRSIDIMRSKGESCVSPVLSLRKAGNPNLGMTISSSDPLPDPRDPTSWQKCT